VAVLCCAAWSGVDWIETTIVRFTLGGCRLSSRGKGSLLLTRECGDADLVSIALSLYSPVRYHTICHYEPRSLHTRRNTNEPRSLFNLPRPVSGLLSLRLLRTNPIIGPYTSPLATRNPRRDETSGNSDGDPRQSRPSVIQHRILSIPRLRSVLWSLIHRDLRA